MADITDPDKIDFCDKRVRIGADIAAQFYNWAKAVLAEWYAQGGNSWIPNNANDDIKDKANPLTGAGDGRHPITGEDVNNIMNRLQEIVTDYEANSSAKLYTVLGVAVNITRGG